MKEILEYLKANIRPTKAVFKLKFDSYGDIELKQKTKIPVANQGDPITRLLSCMEIRQTYNHSTHRNEIDYQQYADAAYSEIRDHLQSFVKNHSEYNKPESTQVYKFVRYDLIDFNREAAWALFKYLANNEQSLAKGSVHSKNAMAVLETLLERFKKR